MTDMSSNERNMSEIDSNQLNGYQYPEVWMLCDTSLCNILFSTVLYSETKHSVDWTIWQNRNHIHNNDNYNHSYLATRSWMSINTEKGRLP